MAIQAQFYSDDIGFPVGGGGAGNGGGGGGEFNQFRPSLQQQQLQQPWNQILYLDQQEIDQFIISQNERLRLLLQEQSKRQITVMLKQIEWRASILVNKKDEEIQKARNKTMELQNLLKKLEMDNQIWKRVAHENQAKVMSLNNKLETLREQQQAFNNGVEDAESCCEVKEREEGLICKMCKCGSSSCTVLFLPCRHLCSCKDCEPLLDSCPVCTTRKKGSIEALTSLSQQSAK